MTPAPVSARDARSGRWQLSARTLAAGLLALGIVLVPLYSVLFDDAYTLTLASRILVFALAAVGLNVLLGFGGLVSLGHALYLGLGAYTVMLAHVAGIDSGWTQLAIMGAVVLFVAVIVGWVALRTSGIGFIMITLAFSQLFYYVFVSLKGYGGEDGMRLQQPSQFGRLSGNGVALYICLAVTLAAAVYAARRLAASRFGLVLRGARINERRVTAVGTSPMLYRLTAYVMSALICGVAGFFLANLTGFVSPAYLDWTVSGELIVIVVLGGVGSIGGPIAGAVVLLLVEEVLKSWTEFWPMIEGPLIILAVLGMERGLWGLLAEHRWPAVEKEPRACRE
ncbi:MAG: branched-chain amino acid ABC transporter permease [Burkholderiales bacterium]|nr:branched-chain amino acid ABC transporter permease [Burkholderiales bacterium]MDE1925828.1 branched-chain amino acid ABC transporter permease [Burkholderiales bacterium]